MILDGQAVSLHAALNTLEIYGTVSGLKVNTDKTQIVWIGKKKHAKEKIDTGKNLVWGNTDFNLLGIKFSVDLNCMEDMNYKHSIESVKELLNKWKKRFLTPLGKIAVIKALALPKFNHLFASLPTPTQDKIKTINNLFYSFIWDDKPDKINRNRMTKSFQKGGLNMIDIEKFIYALKSTWVKRLWNNDGAQWTKILDYRVLSRDKLVLLGPSWHKTLNSKVTNPFWKDILLSWSKINENIPLKTFQDFITDSFWYNFKIGTESFFLPNWYKAGIFCAADIMDSKGILPKITLEKTYKIRINFLEYHRVKLKVEKLPIDIKDTYCPRPIIPKQLECLHIKKCEQRAFTAPSLKVVVLGKTMAK